jgi:hypothetical protein
MRDPARAQKFNKCAVSDICIANRLAAIGHIFNTCIPCQWPMRVAAVRRRTVLAVELRCARL